MIEAPEARLLAEELNRTVKGKTVTTVVAAQSPHKFAWYYGDPADYERMLAGKRVGESYASGGYLEMPIGDVTMIFADGTNLRYYAPGEELPRKHQLLIGFDDESCLVASIRMYGAMLALPPDPEPVGLTPYYEGARAKPQVMSAAFTREYFGSLIEDPAVQNKSAKAFLATEQRIPGLGNGVLQDILYNAGVNPKTKIERLSAGERARMYDCVVATLGQMYDAGGRNSESDLSGRPGGYIPHLSKDTAGHEGPRCGAIIIKENYLGGSIYYCPGCQSLRK